MFSEFVRCWDWAGTIIAGGKVIKNISPPSELQSSTMLEI